MRCPRPVPVRGSSTAGFVGGVRGLRAPRSPVTLLVVVSTVDQGRALGRSVLRRIRNAHPTRVRDDVTRSMYTVTRARKGRPTSALGPTPGHRGGTGRLVVGGHRPRPSVRARVVEDTSTHVYTGVCVSPSRRSSSVQDRKTYPCTSHFLSARTAQARPSAGTFPETRVPNSTSTRTPDDREDQTRSRPPPSIRTRP